MTRVIVIDLAGDEELEAESKVEAAPYVKLEEWSAPAEGPGLLEVDFDDKSSAMPAAYRALLERCFRK
jgi:hypothetical protein